MGSTNKTKFLGLQIDKKNDPKNSRKQQHQQNKK